MVDGRSLLACLHYNVYSTLAYAAYLSLFSSRLIGGSVFSGLSNYEQAFKDPLLWSALGHIALFILIGVPLGLILSTSLALALDSRKVWGGSWVRLGIFVPYAVPAVVGTLMWGYIYGRNYGLVTQVTRVFDLPVPDLLSTGSILGSIINITLWEYIGYNMVVLYSALRAVPVELYDAAAVDGAGSWKTAWHIKLPSIRPAIILTIIFSLIGAFQLFNEPNLLSLLAPAAVGPNYTPSLYAYNVAFQNQNLNYAAAISFVMGIVTVIASYVVQLLIVRRTRLP